MPNPSLQRMFQFDRRRGQGGFGYRQDSSGVGIPAMAFTNRSRDDPTGSGKVYSAHGEFDPAGIGVSAAAVVRQGLRTTSPIEVQTHRDSRFGR